MKKAALSAIAKIKARRILGDPYRGNGSLHLQGDVSSLSSQQCHYWNLSCLSLWCLLFWNSFFLASFGISCCAEISGLRWKTNHLKYNSPVVLFCIYMDIIVLWDGRDIVGSMYNRKIIARNVDRWNCLQGCFFEMSTTFAFVMYSKPDHQSIVKLLSFGLITEPMMRLLNCMMLRKVNILGRVFRELCILLMKTFLKP